MREKTQDRIAYIVVGVLVIFTVFTFLQALNYNEQNECKHWLEDSQVFGDYYLLTWQKKQCDHWGISIDVPIYAERQN